jgi:hypothetical protein
MMKPARESVKRADLFWAAFLGCAPEDLSGSRIIVVSPAGRKDSDGAILFRRDRACIVSVPGSIPHSTREALCGASIDRVFDPEFLAASFALERKRIGSPSWMDVCDPIDFTPVPLSAQLLKPGWKEQLADRYSHGEWVRSGFFRVPAPSFGLCQADELIAVSGYFAKDGMADIRVGMHPSHQGKGYEEAVISAAVRHAFEKELIPMVCTEVSDKERIACARSLGFSPYAMVCGVQVTEPEL